jgi:hypothetical protein
MRLIGQSKISLTSCDQGDAYPQQPADSADRLRPKDEGWGGRRPSTKPWAGRKAHAPQLVYGGDRSTEYLGVKVLPWQRIDALAAVV